MSAILENTAPTSTSTEIKFSSRLRMATRRVHSMAEQTCFIKGFLKGTASLESYGHLLTDLLEVYRAMEGELDRLRAAEDPLVANFALPELYRVPALERDLACLRTLSTEIGSAPSEAALIYAERLREVSKTAPHRLIGHLYTRYLGDLSGGQILARIASRSMGLSWGAGLDFYDFGEKLNVDALKARFRAQLDGLDDGGAEICDDVVDEAIAAFRHNIALFESLTGNPWKTLLRNLPFIGHKVA